MDTEVTITTEQSVSREGVGDPPAFGRCPVCGKPLRPRDLLTGEPKAPEPGQGKYSRAICTGCGNIIEYIGGGKWKLANPN